MFSLLLAAAVTQAQFDASVERVALKVYVTAACQRYMEPLAGQILDVSQYRPELRQTMADAVEDGRNAGWTFAQCKRAIERIDQ